MLRPCLRLGQAGIAVWTVRIDHRDEANSSTIAAPREAEDGHRNQIAMAIAIAIMSAGAPTAARSTRKQPQLARRRNV